MFLILSRYKHITDCGYDQFITILCCSTDVLEFAFALASSKGQITSWQAV